MQSKDEPGIPTTQFPCDTFHMVTWPSIESATTTVSFPEPQNFPTANAPRVACIPVPFADTVDSAPKPKDPV